MKGWGKGRRPAFRLPVEPDQVVRHVLAAYYRAVGDATAPQGCPDPATWSDPELFLNTLVDFFTLRLTCEAAAAGHPIEAEPERLARWESFPPYRDQHIRDVDPGLWDQVQGAQLMAQGCAASSPAVGPAAEADQSRAEVRTADPLFLGPERQELPEVAASGTQNTTIGVAQL